MYTCKKCGTQNPDDALLCRYCGTENITENREEIKNGYCPYCGAQNPMGSKFCGGCGKSLMPDDGNAYTDTAGQDYYPSAPKSKPFPFGLVWAGIAATFVTLAVIALLLNNI